MEYRRYGYDTRSHGANCYGMDQIKKPITTATMTTTNATKEGEVEGSRQFGTELPQNVLDHKLQNQNQRNAANHARKRKFHEVNDEQKEKEESFDMPAKKFRYNLRSRKERTESTELMGKENGAIRAAHHQHQHPQKNMDIDSEGSCDEDIDLVAYQKKQYSTKPMLKQQPQPRRSMRLRNKRIRKLKLETRTIRVPQVVVPEKPKEPVYVVEDEGMECDIEEADDDLHVSQYVSEIMKWYDECEASEDALNLIKKDYISSSFQPDLNKSMRLILLNWVYNVHRRFKLLDRTLFLGIYIFDAYLSLHPISRKQLQLIGCASMWIASKYHEIYAPEANDFAYISDHSFTVDQIFKAELSILCELKFRFADIITPLQFSQRYLQVAVYPICKKYKDRGTAKASADGKRYCDLVEKLTNFFLELALFDCNLISNERPSKIAAASLCFAVLSISLYPQWPDFLMRYTKYDYDALKPILNRLNELRALTTTQLKSLRKKRPEIKKWLDRLNIDAVVNNKYQSR